MATPNTGAGPSARQQPRLLVLVGLPLLSAGLTWSLLRDGIPVSLDSSSQYWPWYAYLGHSLRDGRIPAWNPSTFGGTPFAADPLSGWTYVPAMALFAALPPAAAIAAFLFSHFWLASLATAALARTLGLTWPAAALSGAVYAASGSFQFESVAAQPFVGVEAWLPVSFLGVERALRTTRGEARWAWWSMAGLALSQIIATWPGQGAYYAIVLFGTWTAARVLARPGRPIFGLARAAAHTCAPVALGFSLAAAGILPRLEYQALSNLANGYATEDQVGGWRLADFARLITPGPWYLGIFVFGLALIGLVLLARSNELTRAPFVILAAQWLAVLALAGQARTPLYALLAAVLPGFASVHVHIPERILVVGYLAPALLTGLGISLLQRQLGRSWPVWIVAAAACLELVFAGRLAVDRQVAATWDPLQRVVDFDASLAPSDAARFLLAQPTPFRYLGYDGEEPYTLRFGDPRAIALLVNNRALSLGLQDVQGYDAVHLARFDAYLTAVNGGRTQNYHDGQVFRSGLDSPLLDLLNVRFLVLARDSPLAGYTVVYQDASTRVVERPNALPRGWLVHETRQASRDEALGLIATGAVDPRRTALLEHGQAATSSDTLAAPGQVNLVAEAPERQVWQVTSDSQGVLVTSEVAYPAWATYVDGKRAPALTADGILRAVTVPPGQHTVEVRYESTTLSVGLALSVLSLVGVAAILLRLALAR